jgi:plasmid replication initiation protein
MDGSKKIDKRDSLRVVTNNSIIDARDLPKLSLDARKLFYVAVSQCRQNDKEFYQYETTPAELAEMWGVTKQAVYKVAKQTCKELMGIVITIPQGAKGFKMRHLFEKCDYDDDAVLTFKLHSEMTDLLLGLKRDFSKPLVWDFMKMRSPYSMALWHYFQKEMHSFKPMMSSPIVFDVTLEELRRVTGCEDKLKQIGEFKKRVLDKALVEIQKNCCVRISYDNLKKGRKVVGFRFTAENVWGTVTPDNMSHQMQKRMRKADLVRREAEGTITSEEYDELQELILELDQMTIEDFC